jgi:D-lactate dehydrogenase
LIIEVDGVSSSMHDAVAAITKAVQCDDLLYLNTAHNERERTALWEARKGLSPLMRTLAPKKINEDIVVPVSHIPELIEAVEQLSQKYHIIIVCFGHAGNGNIHVNLLINPDDPVQSARAAECLSEMFTWVLQLKGTLSGEHGVGIEKRDFITREIAAPSLDIMRRIKGVFDPYNILNPGKIFPQ